MYSYKIMLLLVFLVCLQSQSNIPNIIKSGYREMLGYWDPEGKQLIIVDLGAIDMFHEGME